MSVSKVEVLEYLLGFLTDNRKKRFSEVMAKRTRYITVVLEDIYQSQNASAVLRSCDCFGIQDVHIIENKNQYTINPDVALGSSKWLSMTKYNKKDFNTNDCISRLRSMGYTIVATSPHKNDFTPEKLPLHNKVAILFGTELNGLTEEAIRNSDIYLRIPMFGFTESFNISVSAALVLYHLSGRMRNEVEEWNLTDDEQLDLMLNWARTTVKKSKLLEKEFVERKRKLM